MPASWTPRRDRVRREDQEPRCDAYTGWLLASGFRDSRTPDSAGLEPKAVWLMLKLRAVKSGGSPPAELFELASKLRSDWLLVPAHYRAPLRGLDEARFCTAIASVNFIRYLIDPNDVTLTPSLAARLLPLRAIIEAFTIGLQANDCADRTGPDPLQCLPEALDGQVPATVIGVIDDGLPFAHRRVSWIEEGLRRTRFIALWDQSGSDAGAGDRSWCLGHMLNQAEMNESIDAGTSDFGANERRVDEDAVYHHAGMAKLLRHRITHGAHVLDLACGAEPLASREDAATLPAIVGVQMRPMESTLSLSAGAHLFDAIRFVVAAADAACAKNDPCQVVINASVGHIAGPHDGHSLFEEAVDELLHLRRKAFPPAPVDVVLPEGNSYLSRCHALGYLPCNSTMPLAWRLRPDDGTSNYLEIWLRPLDGESGDLAKLPLELTLTLSAPGVPDPLYLTVAQGAGHVTGSLESELRDSNNVLAVAGFYPQPANGLCWMALIAVAPTAPYEPWPYCAPAGAWHLQIFNGPGSTAVECNVYSQRDDRSFGHKGRGRQAILEDGYDRVRDERGKTVLTDPTTVTTATKGRSPTIVAATFRRRAGTLNALATGAEVRVAGGLLVKPGGERAPAPYSSVGGPADVNQAATRSLAVTEDSLVLHGIHAAGTRSGTVVSLSGTSMAAPQLTRALALNVPRSRSRAEDHNKTRRPVVEPDPDLLKRSKRRRGAG